MHPYDNGLEYRISTTADYNEGGVSTASLTVNQWVHVTYLKTGNTLRLYLDGAVDSAVTLAGTSVANSGPLYIGKDPWYDGTQCDLDDIRVYSRALSSAEIGVLANNVSDAGLVGHWRFDEAAGSTAYDASGYGKDGTLSNSPTRTAGQIGSGALSFDGTDDYVQVGAQANLVMTDRMTLSAWIYPTGGGGIIVNKEGEYEIAITSGTVQWAVANTSPGWAWIDTAYAPPVNQWSHVALVYDLGVVRTYANGTLVHTCNGSGPIGDADSSLNDFRIGGRQYAAQYFAGRIDDVRVYRRPLFSAEIGVLANALLYDSDGDGVPDYLEDRSGNGQVDTGETAWNSATDLGLKVLITRPKNNSIIP